MRMSEPRNYSLVTEPAERTALCAELPVRQRRCLLEHAGRAVDGQLVSDTLTHLGIPICAPVLQVAVAAGLPQAYPIYQRGYETYLQQIEDWLHGIPNVLTLGRQGLFAHDNTHHTLAMAYAAVDCLDERGGFNQAQWKHYRKVFESHVVED